MQYNGIFHLFYQYDATGVLGTGPKSWGHAVSKDLVHWSILSIALAPDQHYDISGVWSGSATITPTGPVIIYTGVIFTNASTGFPWIEAQCRAYPSDLSDPLLTNWTKDPQNPLLVQPKVAQAGFRDPTTLVPAAGGRQSFIVVGTGLCGNSSSTCVGAVLPYLAGASVSPPFTLLPPLASSFFPGAMWECPDLYPLASSSSSSSPAASPSTSFVFKASIDPETVDMWAVGSLRNYTFAPKTKGQIDYGNVYASKSFLDEEGRRILWGWIREDDSSASWVARGWAGVQTLPRLVSLAEDSTLIFLPVPEVKTLRVEPPLLSLQNVLVSNGTFLFPHFNSCQYELDVSIDPNQSAPSFGLRLLLSPDGREYTDIILSPANATVTVDRSSSSLAPDANRAPQVAPLSVHTSSLSLRILIFVDHSVIEIFVNGGQSVITSRVYPVLESQGLALFATGGSAVFSYLSAWTLASIW